MNQYLEPAGFLGTGASLLADITLLAYVLLLVPGMIAGFVFARQGRHRPQHKWTMIIITLVNWGLIIFLMLAAYRFDVAPNIGSQPGNARYLLPTIHGLLGIPAQLLATYVIYRMLREDTQVAQAKGRGETDLSRYWFKSAKPVMRVTLLLWLATALLGVFSYLIRYEVIPAFGAAAVAPAATEEPLATPEVTPASFNDDDDDDGGSPAFTPEADPEPAETPDVDDDDDRDDRDDDDVDDVDDDDNSGSGSSSGSGSGG